MRDGGMRDVVADLKVGIAACLRLQDIQQARGHDHQFAIVMLLRDVDQRVVALGFEFAVIFRAAGGDAGDEALGGEIRAEAAQHLGVEFVAEVEDVTRVRIEHEDHLDAVMIGALLHPAHAFGEAVPIRLLVLEGQQRGDAKAGLRFVIDEGFLAGVGPDGVAPGRGGFQIGSGGDEVHD